VYGVNVAVIVFAGGLCLATAVMTPRLRRSELTCDVYAAHRGYPMTPTAYAWLSEQAPHLPLPLVTPPVVHPPHLAHPLPRGPSHPTGLNPRGHRSPRDSAVQTRLRLLRQLYAGPLRFLDVASVLGTVPQGLPSHRTNVAPALDPCVTGERSPVERLGHVSRIVLGSVIACQPNGYGQPVTRCDTLRYVADGLWWREQDAEYIRRRSVRYPGAIGIELEWTVEAAADPRRIVRDPDPKSRSSAIRVIGYSPSPGFVITVIATRSDHAGVTA